MWPYIAEVFVFKVSRKVKSQWTLIFDGGVTALVASIPIQLKDLQVFTVARVIFQLADEIPRISAVVVALLAEPKPRIDYTLKAVRGSLTAIPGLSAMIDDTVDTIVIDMLQWPHRIVFPIGGIPVDLSDFELKPQRKLIVTVVKATNLKNKELIGKSDPYPTIHIHLYSKDKETQSLTVEVFDKDVGQDERLGLVKLPLSSLEAGVTKELELNLSKMWPYIAETIFRPNGAHRCHNYMKYPNIMKLGEAAILHYTYSKFSDLTARRDRCCCKPKEEDVKICFMLDFDRAISPLLGPLLGQGKGTQDSRSSYGQNCHQMGSDSDRDEIEAMTVQELKSHIEKSWAPCERTQTRTYLNFTTSYGQQFYLMKVLKRVKQSTEKNLKAKVVSSKDISKEWKNIKPLRVRYGTGLSGSDHDMEGRMDWIEDWDRTLSNHIKDLEKSKPVVLTGDLNCAHEEIDIFNPAGNRRSAGFTIEERQSQTS
ncbi:unnamed protein product [Arabidopsis thaliana]|uniref:(thale cress) hypothetical protein n=1 Tax=Arabidopsis thaliana TaxID=3702 RepID=A0A7G2ET82_ARATH|nr:unnamed protein product [Arabidopsis thaliana]